MPALKPSAPMEPKFRKDVIRAIRIISDYAVSVDKAGSKAPPPSAQDCKAALEWIVKEVCLWNSTPFFPDDRSGRTDAFMLGRRYVAKQILMALDLKPEIFED